jgi:hypothetical protein
MRPTKPEGKGPTTALAGDQIKPHTAIANT